MRDLQQQDEPLNDFEAVLRALQPRADRLPSQGPPTPRAATDCTNPSGHEFVCIHCGCETPATVRRRRWAWPTAFGAMTTVAAVLLVAIFLQQPTANVATIEPDGSSDLVAQPTASPSYVTLRNQVLRNGVESWQPVDSSDGGKGQNEASPVPCREQIENLLKELNHAG
ncbi:MAG: hypothetical protein LLF97_04480 [Planctomycetaceae bacterium]|nr:hypothetical protein [Planctomycetaceae bacterium]